MRGGLIYNNIIITFSFHIRRHFMCRSQTTLNIKKRNYFFARFINVLFLRLNSIHIKRFTINSIPYLQSQLFRQPPPLLNFNQHIILRIMNPSISHYLH